MLRSVLLRCLQQRLLQLLSPGIDPPRHTGPPPGATAHRDPPARPDVTGPNELATTASNTPAHPAIPADLLTRGRTGNHPNCFCNWRTEPGRTRKRPDPAVDGPAKTSDPRRNGLDLLAGGYLQPHKALPLKLSHPQVQPTPRRAHDSHLDGLSCASGASCVAVGVPAEAWTGTRWAVIPPPGPVSSVSCPAPGSCQAVGPPPFGTHPVAARWDGRTWQAEPVPTPVPAPQNLTLTSVSCTSARFCMAVGDASHGAQALPSPMYRDRTLAEEWNGSRWRIVRTPNPSRASELRGVSCTSPAACTAVGSSASEKWTLAERWNGTRWTIQHTPTIRRLGYTVLTAVSCTLPAACTAVGTYNAGEFGIAAHWNGPRWTIQRLPTPPGPPGEDPLVIPASISCTTPAACMTVGTTQNMTLAERWNGARWIIEPTPNPT